MMNLCKKLLPLRSTPPRNGLFRIATLTAVSSVLLYGTARGQAFGQTGQTANDTKDAPAIEPDAINALDKMAAYLRTLKAFQVKSDVTTDDVLDTGQTIESSKTVNLLAVPPNRMRVEVASDDQDRIFFFDGKNFTVFGKVMNFYATVPAPTTIGKLISDVDEKYDIELPLTDLFFWGTNDVGLQRIKGAVDIGPSTVDGVTCEQYAFHQENVDWQIWIQLGDFPLPLKLVIRTLTDDAKPQHSETLKWNLAPSYSDDAFTFDPPPDARRIVLADVQANAAGNATEKKK